MKRITFNYLALFLGIAVVISSCCSVSKMQKVFDNMDSAKPMVKYEMTPAVLEEHADTVAISIGGKIPEKCFCPKAVMTFTPIIKYEGGEKELTTVTYQGEKVEANNQVIKKTGGSVSYSDKFGYIDAMRFSTVEMKVTAAIGTKPPVEFKRLKIGDGIKATPKLLVADPKPIFVKDKFVRVTTESKKGEIFFDLQKDNLRAAESKKEDVKALLDYLTQVVMVDNKEFKGAQISSYASPDGPEDLNTKLSIGRAKTATGFLNDGFKKTKAPKTKDKVKDKEMEAKVKGKIDKLTADKTMYSEKNTAEDWDGFKTQVGSSDLKDKDLILRVLTMYNDPIVREKEIKNISAVYNELRTKVLPQLRRSVMTINVDVVGKSDADLSALADSKPDSLNVEELLYAASLTKDLNKQATIYQSCTRIFPNEWRGWNDLGYVNVKLNKISEAKAAFEGARKLEDKNNTVINNQGVIAYLEKDYQKAEELFTTAKGAGEETNYNLGLLAVRKADYSGAVSLFGSACCFNAGLAKLLNGDNEGAVKAVECDPNKEVALNYYLKAISGARSSNTDLMYNSLRAAISKDPKLAAFAQTDVEFLKYFTDDTFKAIVK